MSDQAILIYHPDFLEYNFGPQHPLRPERLTTGLDLLSASGIYRSDVDTPPVSPATRSDLELVHGARYIDAVIGAGNGDAPPVVYAEFGLHSHDNPPFPCMHEASALVTGGTLMAARAIMRGEVAHAFNPAGGLHHAHHARASGFCVYNDPAVAAAAMTSEFHARVFYVDFDCHHGDGVQWIFYRDPQVFTLSYHETGQYLFPGTGDAREVGEGEGRGTSANVPFAPYTENSSWQTAIEATFPVMVERFRPDILITNHGSDTHDWDPLTHLSLTTHSHAWQAKLSHEIAHAYTGGRWLAVGGGAHDWRRVVPRSWALLWAEMAERRLDPDIPVDWLLRWDTDAHEPLPRSYLDAEWATRPVPRRLEIEETNRETVQLTLRLAGIS